MSKKPSEARRLAAAWRNSREGLKSACGQAAFRVEIMFAAVLLPLALLLGDDGVERALLVGSTLLVMIVELLNTGIETAIDRISKEWHELSKIAKDVGSAAVLLSLINFAAVWLLVLFG